MSSTASSSSDEEEELMTRDIVNHAFKSDDVEAGNLSENEAPRHHPENEPMFSSVFPSSHRTPPKPVIKQVYYTAAGFLLMNVLLGLLFGLAGAILLPILMALTIAPSFLLSYLAYFRRIPEEKREDVAFSYDLWWTCIWSALGCIPVLIVEISLAYLGYGIVVLVYGDSAPSFSNLDSLNNLPIELALVSAFYVAFIIAGFTEETMKFLVLHRQYRKNHIHHPYGCILTGGAAALGFATVENCLYVYSGLLAGGWLVGFATAIARFIVSVPMHFGTGIILGGSYSAKQMVLRGSFDDPPGSWFRSPIRILLIPITIHGMFNFSIYIGLLLLAWFPFVFLPLILVAGYFFIVRFLIPWAKEYADLLGMEPFPTVDPSNCEMCSCI